MSAEVTIHDCVDTKVETVHKDDVRWTTYTFTDARGQKLEVTVFDRTVKDTLRKFVGDRERFEASSGVGS